MRLIYVAHMSLPTERAHSHQIMQMCEAFADEGAAVTLLVPSYHDPSDGGVGSMWDRYDVKRNFGIQKLRCLNASALGAWLPGALGRAWLRLAWGLRMLTFTLAVVARLRREDQVVAYSRDPLPLWVIARLWPRRASRVFFEAHSIPSTRTGRYLRRQLAARIGGMVMTTGQLDRRYASLGLLGRRSLIAHDGVRLARFAIEGDRESWRVRAGWPADAFLVGYAGRFQTLGMEKGISVLGRALAELTGDARARPVRLVLVGGPGHLLSGLRKEMADQGLPSDRLIYAGWVRAAEIPRYLRAFDVCALPFPWTEHFAYAASPLKLFEYMASGTPLVASDLPAIAEVIHDGENGLLVPPGDASALADALRRLRDDSLLGERLARRAAEDVKAYSWNVRARKILDMIEHSVT
jgi:glycosyltransferase involved in cell wall biosynthesis